jgi:hypothetical protein
VPDFGASLEGVKALLPTTELDDDTRPTAQQVRGFIDGIGALVSARIGDLATVSADRRDVFELAARGVVHLGAAAMAEDAAHPSMTGPDDTSYGSVLWERYREQLDDLAALFASEDGGGPLVGGGGEPAVSAPPPLFRRDTGF